MSIDPSIGSGVSVVGVLANNVDVDEFEVFLNNGEMYDFWMAADANFDDPFLLLAALGGGAVEQDDDSGENIPAGNPDGSATFLFQGDANTYELAAREFTGSGDGGTFFLAFTNKSRSDDISDHTFATEISLGTGPGGVDEYDIPETPTVGTETIGTYAVLAEEDVLRSELTALNGFANDADMVAVFLTAGQTYDFTLVSSDVAGGSNDPDLILCDFEGNLLASNFDVGDSIITGFDPGVTGTGTGWYFLEANLLAGNYRLSFDDTGGGAFDFDVPGTISVPAGLVANAGGDVFVQNPFNLPLNDTIQGDLEAGGDADWYAIHLVAGFTYRFTGEGGSLGNLTLQVRDATGVAQAGGGASGPEPQTVDFVATTTGLYYLDVHGQTGADSGTFSLSSQLLSTGGATTTAHDITGIDGTSYAGSDLIDNITGGADADSIVGAPGDDTLLGGAGADTLHGGSDDDLVDGGDDNDTIGGEAGSDTMFGGGGDDNIDAGSDGFSDIANGGDGNDTILGSFGPASSLAGDAGDDSIFGFNSDNTLLGGDGNDTIGSDSGFGLLDGGIGNDSLVGRHNDTILGGEGDDTIDGGFEGSQSSGGNGNDTFNNVSTGDRVTAGAGVDQINSLIGWTLDIDEENLTLLGGATINGNGNTGGNVIFGNNGANQLSGLGGNDTVNGGAGNDTLIGGFGKDLNTGSGGLDHIKFNALGESGTTFATRDAINTFAHGDKIDLSAIDANTNIAGNQAFTFSSSQSLTGLSGLVIAQRVATNSFLVLADINGDHNADFSLNVYTSPGFGNFAGFDFIL